MGGQFEFFADGTVVRNGNLTGRWEQTGTGTFKFIDLAHVKIDLGWFAGTTIYEVDWLDSDHIRLRAADETDQFHRVK